MRPIVLCLTAMTLLPAAADSAEGVSYCYVTSGDRLIPPNEEGTVTRYGSNFRRATRSDGYEVVTLQREGKPCATFDSERRTYYLCGELAELVERHRVSVSVSVSELRVQPGQQAVAENIDGVPTRHSSFTLTFRTSTTSSEADSEKRPRFLKDLKFDFTLTVDAWMTDGPPQALLEYHAGTLGHFPEVSDRLRAELSRLEGFPRRLRARTTRRISKGEPVTETVTIDFSDVRLLSSVELSLFEIPPGFRHQKPVIGVPVK